jgi:Tol biopolymer transport system component/predicted Ser/Thr protein kinase
MDAHDSEGAPQAPRELSKGEIFGRYLIIEKIGAGGTGAVYAARDRKLGRKVALKLLRPPGGGGESAQDTVARLLLGAQAMAKLADPNVTAAYEVGTIDDQVFVAMELINGVALSKWQRDKRRSRSEILHVFRQAGEGLAAAHAAGVVHGDFKPGNILVGSDGRVHVIDFGLARPWEPPDDTSEDVESAGHALGTALYRAPEQHLGEPADARADQYSYCACFHEALYGEPPFDAKTIPELVRRKRVEQIKQPLWADRAPDKLRRVLLRGLRAKPEERYPAMEDLLKDLPRESSADRRAVLLSLGTMTAVAAGVLFLRSRPARPKPTCAPPPVHFRKKRFTTVGMVAEPVFSPDGSRLAYVWKGRDLVVVDIGPDGSAFNRRAVVTGVPMTRPRWLAGGAELTFVGANSPDERYVVALGAAGPPRRVTGPLRDTLSLDGRLAALLDPKGPVLSIEDLSTGRVETLALKDEYRPLEEGAFSLLGDRLLLITKESVPCAIRTVGLDDKREQEVSRENMPLRWAGWSPRGDAIYALRSDNTFLWIPIDPRTGGRAGASMSINQALRNVESMSLSRDGKRLVYAAGGIIRDLSLVTLAGPNGAGKTKVERITSDGTEKIGVTVSPDGKSVAFRRADRRSSLCTVPLSGPVNPDWVTCFGGREVGDQIAWSPDGRALAFTSSHEGTTKVFRIGTDATDLGPLGGGDVGSALVWGPGKNVVYQSKKDLSLMLLDPETGKERVLAAKASPISGALASPDGKLIAVERSWERDPESSGLFVVSVEDGTIHKLATGLRPVGWSSDRRHVYAVNLAGDAPGGGAREIVAVPLGAGGPSRVGALPFEQGAAQVLGVPGADLRFVCEVVDTAVDLWMVDDFNG